MTTLYRCKRIKPGDGGVVDGCGWQGPHAAKCPSCGSTRLRPVAQTVTHDPTSGGKVVISNAPTATNPPTDPEGPEHE